jgi:HAD superfamily phosphatase (TIGR01681 family)
MSEISIENYKVFVFDLDDTLYLHRVNYDYRIEYTKKIREFLQSLRDMGKILCLATHNKSPYHYLNKMDISELFDEIVNRLSKQSISGSEANPNSDSSEGGQEVPLENEFNRMPIDQVALFFIPLIETENSAGEKWMTPESFDIFLRRSFGKEKSLQKPEIKLGKGTKGAIIELFYKFYSHCIDKNHSSKREKIV